MNLWRKARWRGRVPLTLAIVFVALASLLLADHAEARKKKGNFGGQSGASVQKRFSGSGSKKNVSRNKQTQKRTQGGFNGGVNKGRSGNQQGQFGEGSGDRQEGRS